MPAIKGHWIMIFIMLLFWSHRVQFTPSLFLSWVATWNGLGQLNGLEKSQVIPTTSNNKPAKIGESTGFTANFGYVSGIICGLCYFIMWLGFTRVVFWNPTRLNLGTSSMMWQTGPAAQTFWCSQSAGRLSALDFPGVAWKHLRTFENLIIYILIISYNHLSFIYPPSFVKYNGISPGA